jgi:hypothetical protein
MRRGVLGGDHRWVTIWAVIAAAQVVHRLAKPKTVVERFELQPGETVVIRDLGQAE